MHLNELLLSTTQHVLTSLDLLDSISIRYHVTPISFSV